MKYTVMSDGNKWENNAGDILRDSRQIKDLGLMKWLM